jgi:DNA-binding response OmpR family regulator
LIHYGAAAMGKPRMLIVDDHSTSRETLRRYFEIHDWEVVTAGLVKEALALLTPKSDCLILDLSLPDGDGEQILDALREQEAKTCVVIMSAISDTKRLLAVEANYRPAALFTKPVNFDALIKVCDEARAGARAAGKL